VTAAAAVAAAGLLAAPVDTAALAALAGGSGRGVLLLPGWVRALLAGLNAFGVVAVVGVALRSALARLRRGEAGRAWGGNLLIALGVLLLGAAGSASRLPAGDAAFWPLMTAGWLAVYVGFVAVSGGSLPGSRLPPPRR
jgi:hypothetical protein